MYLLVIELKVHAVVYLVVLQPDVVLEDGVPLLQHNLVPPDQQAQFSKTNQSCTDT